MITNDDLKKQIFEIEREEAVLLNNSNMDKLAMIEAKTKEMEHASLDRKKIIAKQIKEAKDEIGENSKSIKSESEKKKISIINKQLLEMSNKIEQKISTLSNELNENTKKLSELKSKMLSSDEFESLNLSMEISRLCNLLIDIKRTTNEIEKIKILVDKAMKLDSYNELLDEYNNVNKIMSSSYASDDELIEHLNSDDDVFGKDDQLEKIKVAESLVEKLEKSLTEDELKKAKGALALLESSHDKNKLAQRITECEKKIENKKSRIKEVRDITTLLDEAKSKNAADKLQEASNRLVALEECPEKLHLVERYNEIKFIICMNECENKTLNSDELIYGELKELIDTYRKFSEDKKNEYAMKLNKVIATHNINDQLKYQDSILNDDSLKKYSFFERFSEFLSGTIWNKIISSNLYSKVVLKGLKKAEDKGNTKRVSVIKSKLSKIGIVNGYRLFKRRNEISKLKPKLYAYKTNGVDDAELRDYEKCNQKYNKAVNFVTNEVTKKLDKFSEKECIIQNKDAVINMIKQYLDVLAITNEVDDIDGIKDETVKFINNAKENGIIDGSQWAAFTYEANSIADFRKNKDGQMYESSNNEVDCEIRYYDSDPVSDKLLYLKNMESK